MAKVRIIHTGGTLGMRQGDDGVWRPSKGYLQGVLNSMPELDDPRVPEWELLELDEPLDSSNMTPDHWVRIAHAIAEAARGAAGTVVLHGTDTMAFTASALSFMLEGLDRPVIVTGSQIPLAEPRTDARDNIITALMLAARTDLHEVCVYFNGELLRGNRATKTDASGFIAFDSPNYPPLGEIGTAIKIHRDLVHFPSAEAGDVAVQPMGEALVGSFRVFPGLQAAALRAVLQGASGLVLECYGTGNAPTHDPELLDVLRQATERGVVVVAVSQCLHGAVDLQRYETGNKLAAVGVTSGHDMTPEAALTKLYYLLAKAGREPAEVRRQMETNLRGELTGGLV
jgi:L-asparaginase